MGFTSTVVFAFFEVLLGLEHVLLTTSDALAVFATIEGWCFAPLRCGAL